MSRLNLNKNAVAPSDMPGQQASRIKKNPNYTVFAANMSGRPAVEVHKSGYPSALNALFLKLPTGKFLDLGSEPGADTLEQTVTGQSNIGLMAALVLTVELDFLFNLPQIREAMFDKSYIGEIMGPEGQRHIYEFFVSTVTCMIALAAVCMIYCVLVVLVVGEMTGKEEVNLLTALMGFRINGSIFLFFANMVVFALDVFLMACVLAETLHTLIITLFVCFSIATVTVGLFWMPLVQSGYKCKHICHTNPPLHIIREDISSLFSDFVECVRPENVAPDTFIDFIAYALQDGQIAVQEYEKLKGEQAHLFSVLQLSHLSRAYAYEVVEEYCAKQAQKDDCVVSFSAAELDKVLEAVKAEYGSFKTPEHAATTVEDWLSDFSSPSSRVRSPLPKSHAAELSQMFQKVCKGKESGVCYKLSYTNTLYLKKQVKLTCLKEVNEMMVSVNKEPLNMEEELKELKDD
eukprot:CAMPEP_0206221028 /NCGR_PEP_ID=MMETSP0047_2-20121206/5191_1 /ASSEMBLY_ACC=CAM_ASM_000192 /TAXON_ID=195065 /ORGANISM="Chroomonas mesostigmatica_cf, Strain CCMP1168" /LENGTH=460 /DNA_ID=CAMNT_0053643725 /DNA_START=31 /DNA_END=1413 /DNA_ORIENTATION=+